MKGMGDMLRQAQMMQRKMQEIQEDMKKRTVEATAGGGMVTVVATGAQDIVSIAIDKSVVDPADVDMLQDLVLAAVNDALKKARDLQQSEMAGLTGGLKIPGLF
ncbi:Nucleoid-associated protein [Fundidesulfovibrio magnetotacticus]|uniref:Nucleoid-associated protein NNJEOMEG_03735 n=1 Tax=Fundidesulfovibrio magnetotacticus TaxID=2730080 RepID=A0A6V8LTS1_9BACT|nr:YbaB/EbfC family nucleoid-associated protein [Fundidesulfovibrio magnetotacticus]GFK95862.1 Nucleoid-associated protein [Fundidesulfovibrio magnetotacticus]